MNSIPISKSSQHGGEPMKTEEILGIVERHRNEQGSLIATLQDIQARYSYLPADALRRVAEETGRSLVDIYGVATFYRAFSLKPRGKHLISCCLGTACHVRGGPAIAEEFSRQLQIQPGDTTADREFTLETVNCLGACALGPVAVADGHYSPHVNRSKVREIIQRVRTGFDQVEIGTDRRIFPVEVSCSRCNHSLMDPENPLDGFPSIRVTQSFGHLHGWLRLSSLYGSYHSTAEYEVPSAAVIQLFCPHCHTELIGATDCPECGVRMVPMIVRGGGVVQICPRRDCRGHILDLG